MSRNMDEKLLLNPHFPVDEIGLLPSMVATRVVSNFQSGGDDGSSMLLQELSCTLATAATLGIYCDCVLPPFRCLKRVIVEGKGGGGSEEELAKGLSKVFSGESTVAHTLVLRGVPSSIACKIVAAQKTYGTFPGLSRLAVEDCAAWTKADVDSLLPFLTENQVLEELFLDSGTLSSNTLALAAQCRHINFLTTLPELAAPAPPKALAKSETVRPPLQEPMTSTDFHRQHPASNSSCLGLLTNYGRVVPLAKELVPRFQLLDDMLKEDETGSNKDEENVVPMEMDPAVGKECVALAVHFVSHFVSDEVHAECVKAEEHQSKSVTWCPAFDEFHTTLILQRFATYHRRFQILCELMALAVFLNCPCLKRFLRVALVLGDIDANKKEAEEEDNTPKVTWEVVCRRFNHVNVRAAPDMNAPVVGTRKLKDEVPELQRNGPWVQIAPGSWMLTEHSTQGILLKKKQAQVTWEVVCRRYNHVNVRAAPDMNAAVVGTRKLKDVVPELQRKGPWIQIATDSWMLTEHSTQGILLKKQAQVIWEVVTRRYNHVNVRAAPDMNAPLVGTRKLKDVVPELQRKGPWIQIATDSWMLTGNDEFGVLLEEQ